MRLSSSGVSDERRFWRAPSPLLSSVVLRHVQADALAHFGASLAYVVLVNQAVHNHFHAKHRAFFALTQYPTVAGGMNPSRSPYDIFGAVESGWAERGVTSAQLETSWAELMAHFAGDIIDFVDGPGASLGITWDAFRRALLADRGAVGVAPWGDALAKVLA
jgi:hypothetical protein